MAEENVFDLLREVVRENRDIIQNVSNLCNDSRNKEAIDQVTNL